MKSYLPLYLFPVIGFIGLFDAIYLSYTKLMHTAPKCGVLTGCEIVSMSSYSQIFGIPVAYLGVLFYLSVLSVFFAYYKTQKETLLNLVKILASVGALMSIYFLFVQIFIIKALCVYCILSALTTFSLAVLVFMLPKSSLSKK